MGLRSLANASGIEICALDEDIHRILGNTGIISTENSSDAHCPLAVSNHYIRGLQTPLNSVQGTDLLPFRRLTYDDLSSANLICIKSMQGLTEFEENEVGNIHDIIDRIMADSEKLFLQPLGGRTNLNSAKGNTAIARSSLSINYFHRDCFSFSFKSLRSLRVVELARNIMGYKVSIKVSCDAEMGGCINPVSGNFIFYRRLCL